MVCYSGLAWGVTRLWVPLLTVLMILFAWGCADTDTNAEEDCEPGVDWMPCTCPGTGSGGIKNCRDDGKGYGDCAPCSDNGWHGRDGGGDDLEDGEIPDGDTGPTDDLEDTNCSVEGLQSFCLNTGCQDEGLLAVRRCQGGLWTTCACQGFTIGTVGDYPMGLGSPKVGIGRHNDGVIRACYDAGGLIYDAFYMNNMWNVAPIQAEKASHCDLAIGADNSAHMVLYSGDNVEGKAMYGVNRGAGWVLSLVDPVDMDYIGYYGAIAVDTMGNPHMFYRDHRTDNLRYVFYRNGAWQGPELLKQMHKVRGSLKMRGERAALVYSKMDSGMAWNLVYAERGADGSWTPEQLGDDAVSGIYGSLAFDAQGRPVIAFKSYDDNALKLATRTGTQWDVVTVDRGPGGDGVTLAIDAEGKYHLAYLKLHEGKLDVEYAVMSGSTIRRARITRDGNATSAVNMLVAPDGKVHIVYRLYVPETGISSVRHATM